MKHKKQKAIKQNQELLINNNKCLICGRKTYKNLILCSDCSKSNYLKEYKRRTRKKKERETKCMICGDTDIMPFVGLCKKHYQYYRTGRVIDDVSKAS